MQVYIVFIIYYSELSGRKYQIILNCVYLGGLPWFLEKTHFKGRVFMTHPTKAIYRYTFKSLTFLLLSLYMFSYAV